MDLHNKREEYAKRIRKQERESSIQEMRKMYIQIAQNYLRAPTKTHDEMMVDREKLQEIAIHLRGEPNKEWGEILKFIDQVVEEFQDLSYLIELGIIKQICLSFKPEFADLKLTQLAGSILNKLIVNSRDSVAPLARMLTTYGLVEDLLKSIVSNKSLADVVEQLHLVGNMISQNGFIRNQFVHSGWIPLLVTLQTTPNLDIEVKQLVVWLMANTVLHYKQKQFNLKFDASSIFADFLIDYFQGEYSTQVKKIALSGLYNLSKAKQSSMCRRVVQKGMIKDMMAILKEKDQTLKTPIWRLLKYLSKTRDIAFHSYLLGERLFDIMGNILATNPQYGNRELIDIILSEMSSVSPGINEALIVHPVFALALDRCKVTVDEKARHNSLILVGFVMSNSHAYCLQTLINNSNFLLNLVENLDPSFSPDIITASLQIIKILIEFYGNLFTPSGNNKIISRLQGTYKLSSRLESIAVVTENEFLRQLAEEIYDKIVKEYQ